MTLFIIYLIAINIVTFAVFAADKIAARNGNDVRKRKPEKLLLGLCLVGGSLGGMLAMYTLRHKTRKWYFVVGLPVFLVLDVAVVVFLHGAGLF